MPFRACIACVCVDVAQAQADLLDHGSSREFATLVDVLRVIDLSPAHTLITRGLVNMLTPNQVVADDIFGGLARLMVIVMQSPPNAGALQDLAPFLSRVLDPNNPLVPGALRAFESFVSARSSRQADQRADRLERENLVLKRAVAVQARRLEATDGEKAALERTVSAQAERLRRAERTNYALSVHLHRASPGGMPDNRPPDVY